NAYVQLIDEGYAVSRERSGYFAAPLDGMIIPSHKAETSFYTSEAVSSPSPPSKLPEGWIRTMRRVLSDSPEAMSVKPEYLGCRVLRLALSDYLMRYRGIKAPPENIIICSGAEDIYGKIVLLLGRDKIFGTENPSYHKITRVYSDYGAKTKPLEMGKDGILSEKLGTADVNILHVTPFDSFPTGVTASASKRREYLFWVHQKDRIIIEDDYDSEFVFGKKPLETLFAMDNNTLGRVIYLNTFSRSISPSVRIGYMIIPDFLLPVCRKRLGEYSCAVPVFDQYVIARYISDGLFERHLNRCRRRLREQKQQELQNRQNKT
ncbi:MAG: PLP-dependent aminotransferase family protein, partial [Acutalibacteraceae bacterium]